MSTDNIMTVFWGKIGFIIRFIIKTLTVIIWVGKILYQSEREKSVRINQIQTNR